MLQLRQHKARRVSRADAGKCVAHHAAEDGGRIGGAGTISY